MIRANEANLKARHFESINTFKRYIEEEINKSVERGYFYKTFDLRDKDEAVIKFVMQWLSELGYKCSRNNGFTGHDGDYDNLFVSWQ